MKAEEIVSRSAIILLFVFLATGALAQGSTSSESAAIRNLGDRDPAVRWASAVAMSRLGAEAVPLLRKALADQHENVRAYAALALGKIGVPAAAALQGLVTALSDKSFAVRENAARAIGEMGPGARQAVDALLACFADHNPYVIGNSAETLSRIGSAAVPGLIKALQSGSANVRWCATIALGKMGPDASPAVAALTKVLTDGTDNERWGATFALGNIGAAARPALPALISALRDRDHDVRSGASLAVDLIDPLALEAQTDWHRIAATIDSLAPRLMREARVPGVAVALINDRALVWSAEYGMADARSKRPVRHETMFEACSMSKPVLGYLAMKLVESGKLDLDRPLASYLQLSSLRGQPHQENITARMVLSHTSGLPNWRKGEEELDGPLPVQFEPGSKFGYSGEGIYYLQKVVERITGEPLDLYARRALFDVRGMAHMSFVWTEDLDSLIAAGHDSAGSFLQKTRYLEPNAAYSLYTSAGDYAHFLIEIMNPDRTGSLSQRFVDTMLSRQVRVDSREPVERPGKARGTASYWGLGWAINTTSAGDIIHHSGSNRSGFRCFSQFNPGTGSGIVIMTNGTGGSDMWTRLISRIGNL